MLTRSILSPSLLLFLGAVIGIGALLGNLLMGVAVAVFLLALVAIDAKPSWKRIFNPPERGARAYEGLRFFSWRRR